MQPIDSRFESKLRENATTNTSCVSVGSGRSKYLASVFEFVSESDPRYLWLGLGLGHSLSLHLSTDLVCV